MTSSRERKASFFCGMVFAWASAFILVAEFYEKLVGVLVAIAKGGTYYPQLSVHEEIFVFGFCVIASSIFFALSLKDEARAQIAVASLTCVHGNVYMYP